MVNGARSPFIEEIFTTLSPIELFEFFRHEPNCFFLDSSMDPQKLGRYSFMGADPFIVISSHGRKIRIIEAGMPTITRGNPFDILETYLEKYRLDITDAPIPFIGGAVGYLSYDLCHFIERLPMTAIDDLRLPESYFGFYDLILAYDNLFKKTYIVSTGFPEQEEEHRLQRAQERLNNIKEKLAIFPHNPPLPVLNVTEAKKSELVGNFTHDHYVTAVAKARQYIIEGDIFEVNISQRFETRLSIPPWELYLRLRNINPAPFASYLGFDKVTIVSSSPERFLRVQGDRVETRPIKGTVRRGKTSREDLKNARKLLASIKDHAENMMIVDLERNDLGRVCRYGSVRVSELAILEMFPTVYHLTSTVVGILRSDKNRYDLLKATFPGGSITGAPKVRSMEIIDELEPTRRSVYTGSIGYLSFDGNMDINIVIRTFIIKGNRAYFQVGGAVVYDSDPESEYQETLDKGRALVKALDLAEPK
jgi:para-aminobenzoate synthetase component 1